MEEGLTRKIWKSALRVLIIVYLIIREYFSERLSPTYCKYIQHYTLFQGYPVLFHINIPGNTSRVFLPE